MFTSGMGEIARKPIATTSHNHPIGGDIDNIRKIRIIYPPIMCCGWLSLPAIFLLGYPRNSLGRKHGFLDETQGTLFFDTAQIIAHHRPAAFVLENVKNLESLDGGKHQNHYESLRDLGYHVQSRVISSEPWVPQKRQRIFIAGFREPTDFDFSAVQVPSAMNGPKLGSILEKDVDPKYTLSKKLWEYLQNYKKKHEAAGNGFGCSVFGPNDVTRTLSQRYYKDGSEILVAQPGTSRRLTPRECARLMGFEEVDGSPLF